MAKATEARMYNQSNKVTTSLFVTVKERQRFKIRMGLTVNITVLWNPT